MTKRAIRGFYLNGQIKFEYLRVGGDIKELRCWEENGKPINSKYIQYNIKDSDDSMAIKIKYICKKMLPPNFNNIFSAKLLTSNGDEKGTMYMGVDF